MDFYNKALSVKWSKPSLQRKRELALISNVFKKRKTGSNETKHKKHHIHIEKAKRERERKLSLIIFFRERMDNGKKNRSENDVITYKFRFKDLSKKCMKWKIIFNKIIVSIKDTRLHIHRLLTFFSSPYSFKITMKETMLYIKKHV